MYTDACNNCSFPFHRFFPEDVKLAARPPPAHYSQQARVDARTPKPTKTPHNTPPTPMPTPAAPTTIHSLTSPTALGSDTGNSFPPPTKEGGS